MGLEERINDDYKAAMRSGDAARKDTLRLLRAALKNAAIAKGRPLDDSDVESELRHQAKMRRDSIDQYGKGGRADLVAAETAELEVIEAYLPEPMSESEIEAAARAAIARVGATGPSDMGAVMRAVMSELGGRADGRIVRDVVTRLLRN